VGRPYFDLAGLCLMVPDGKPANHSKPRALGGKLCTGDVCENGEARRVPDRHHA